MRDCALVRDLLPLYLDGEVSEESRQAISAHLEGCADCRMALARLRAAAVANPIACDGWRPPSAGRTFPGRQPEETPSRGVAVVVRRLRRRLLALMALVALIPMVVSFSIRRYDDWSRRRAVLREQQEMRIQQNGALESLARLSPPAKEMYERLGVSFTVQSQRLGENALRVSYHWGRPGESVDEPPTTGPDTRLYAFEVWGRNLRLSPVDPATGSEVRFSGGQGSAGWGHGGGNGYQEFVGVPAGNLRVKADIPPVLIYDTPTSPVRLDLQLSGPQGETAINRKLTSNGVEFLISRIVVQGSKATVEYQQLTPVETVGVRFLSFLLYPSAPAGIGTRAGMPGGVGGKGDVPHEEIPLKPVPDPARPQQSFDLGDLGDLAAAGDRLTLELQHVVTAIPGTTILSSLGSEGK